MCTEGGQARSKGPHAGVTLLELIVALSLGGTILLGMGFVYGIDYGMWMRGQAKMALNADASRALEAIGRAAGNAAEFSMPAERELHLRFAAPPLGESGPREIVFRVRDQALWRDGEPIVPSTGDTSVGVAELTADTLEVRGTGLRVLTVGLALYLRKGSDTPSDTLRFRTTVHARNRGLGLFSGAGKASGAEILF